MATLAGYLFQIHGNIEIGIDHSGRFFYPYIYLKEIKKQMINRYICILLCRIFYRYQVQMDKKNEKSITDVNSGGFGNRDRSAGIIGNDISDAINYSECLSIVSLRHGR